MERISRLAAHFPGNNADQDHRLLNCTHTNSTASEAEAGTNSKNGGDDALAGAAAGGEALTRCEATPAH